MADTSMEEEDNITADLIEQTPIEKCSLNPRRGRNSRRLLTGFIIYASEVRKQVVEQYPDQNFGFISKLVGDKWKECDKSLRFKYHQRALIHNKRIKELAAREGVSLGDIDLVSGSAIKAPKTSKKSKLSKLEKQAQKRLNDSSTSTTPNHDNKSSVSPETPNSSGSKRLNGTSLHTHNNNNNNDNSTPQSGGTANGTTKHQSTYSTRHNNYQNIQPTRSHSKKINTVDTSTQTPSIVYVDPPPKKPLIRSDAFLRHLEVLQREQDEIVYKNLQLQQQQQQAQQQQLS